MGLHIQLKEKTGGKYSFARSELPPINRKGGKGGLPGKYVSLMLERMNQLPTVPASKLGKGKTKEGGICDE